MDNTKFEFVTTAFITRLKNITPDTKSKWGKMNAQQMVEHAINFFKVASGKLVYPLTIPAEHLPKYREFLYSDKEFRENTRGPEGVVPEYPVPERYAGINEAIDKLEKEINDFVKYFEEHPGAKTLHPVFGELDFEEWVLLHFKHVTHHLRQFGLT